MRLATLDDGSRDGRLLVVNRALTRVADAGDIAPNLLHALEHWQDAAPRLNQRFNELEKGALEGQPFAPEKLMSPLPRCWQFLDGSAYLPHVERVRKARGADMPPSFLHDPLMYQAVCDSFLAPTEPIRVADTSWGIDFEAEVGVIVDDVPMGVGVAEAGVHIQLLVILNDVSLRNLIPAELAKGFGFLQSKPRSSLGPVAITPDELGPAWREHKIHLPLISTYNGQLFGRPEAGEDMQFDFAQLIAHAARTRPLAAGTLIGSGTIANQDTRRGASCLAEKRMLEIIEQGQARTPFMAFGDTIRIEMLDSDGHSLFGAIEQTVQPS